jgi:hypothetical protein
MTLSCFERALAVAEDDNMADVWYVLCRERRESGKGKGWGEGEKEEYREKDIRGREGDTEKEIEREREREKETNYERYNLGQVAVGIGDLGLAYQCFKIATSVDPNHAESYNNLGVIPLSSPFPFLVFLVFSFSANTTQLLNFF